MLTQRAESAIGLVIHYAIDTGRSKMTLECLDCGGPRLGGLADAIAELVKKLFAIAGNGCAGLAFIAGPKADASAGEARPVKQLARVELTARRDGGMAKNVARRDRMSRQYFVGEFI